MSIDKLVEERQQKREARKEKLEQRREEKQHRRDEKHHQREERRAERKNNFLEKKSNRRNRKTSKMGKFLESIIYMFHIILDGILDFILERYWGPRRLCKDTNNDIITKSAVELAQLIREGKLKSHSLIEAYIKRIGEINPDINAVVDGPFEEALDEAKLIDERISKGQISEDEFSEKPFLGVPFTSKDSSAVKDKLFTFGLISRKSYRSKEDSEIAKLIKEAGGIILATTNVPEVNKWMETRNMLFGQTNNPYDLRRSVGGSSGGEASMIAACGTAFGLGTDIGGSIRIPAFCCGVFGHKATTGAINMRGCTLRTGKEQNTMVAAGPMTRYSTDLLPLFKILVGPKNVITLKLNEKVDIKSLKYYYMPQNNVLKCNPVNSETQSIMYKVCEHFAGITGEKVILAELPGIEKSPNLWRYWMTQEPVDFSNLLGNGATINPFIELPKKLMGKSNFTMASIYSLFDAILPREKADLMREITRKMDEALTNLLGEDGILFFHSSPRTAPFHYYNLIKFNDFHYFSIFNVLKVPVTQIPMGLDNKGLPLGIQVVATRNRDRDCLAVAEELEKEFGGWVQPFQIKKKNN